MQNWPCCPLRAACWAPTLPAVCGVLPVLRLLSGLTVSICYLRTILCAPTPLPSCHLNSSTSPQNNLNDLEVLALMIATLSHDLDHRGVNNSYIQRYMSHLRVYNFYMHVWGGCCIHPVFFLPLVCVCPGVITLWPSSTATPPWSITTSTTASWSSTAP